MRQLLPCYSVRASMVRDPSSASLRMGPVSASVAVYVAHRVAVRVSHGQIQRKGLPRMIRRLFLLIVSVHLVQQILQDILEDVLSSQ
jgi:hypothetical protein